ncbi:MAG: response regulator [Spirochaetota bacterium]
MKRILVVDDAATVRMYHRGILESAGFVVEEAFNGLEALEKVAASPFDLYIVDINMPKLDGFGFLRALREKQMVQAPAIIVSTEGGLNDENEALRAGANDYLIKPIKADQFLLHTRLLIGEVLP